MSGSYLLTLAALAASRYLDAKTALLAYLTAIALAGIWTIFRLRPHFASTSHYVRVTLKEARSYGLNLYLARITGTASARLDNRVIAYFLGRAGAGLDALGLYGFAQKLINPIVNMPRAVAITRFRAFAKLDRVPARITRWNALLLLAATSLFVAAGPVALRLIFPKYAGAAPLLLPFALWALFVGLYQPYNSFLASHGRGREIRNIALAATVCSLAGLVVFVPLFGVQGAAWTGATAMALDYALHLYYYRKFQGSAVSSQGATPSL